VSPSASVSGSPSGSPSVSPSASPSESPSASPSPLSYAINREQFYNINGVITALTPKRSPIWTTSGRPASPGDGEWGYNITDDKIDIYNGSSWVQI
jgi:hypothetical protein